MEIGFFGNYKNSKVENGLLLNTITVKLKNGQIQKLDRTGTKVTFEKGKALITFIGTYIWDEDEAQFCHDRNKYLSANIIDYELEDEAEDGYDLEIPSQPIMAWD